MRAAFAIADGIEIAAPAVVREKTPIKLIFAVEGLEQEVARLQAAGVRIVMKPWGVADGVDPEGNVFQITAR